ncbi:MAG: CpsD/CapB family tyrosine-protein kinase [Oscillospiraceae bacterium]|jgi:capsular exopolysaccharide synthesis family protein|nr:CpsD/CapB family tyrosine-protein kinase [Oscillospiraceae bacterium]
MDNRYNDPNKNTGANNAKGDVYDEIDQVFNNLKNVESMSVDNAYTRASGVNKRAYKKLKKLAKKGEIDWMKAFVKAPFQYQEAFLSLRTNISFLSANKELKRIIITSSLPSEGKTSIAVNLSLALSAANHSVMLIDADLRKPRIHRHLQLPGDGKMGMTNILRSKDGLSNGCIHYNIDRKGLSVIPCGIIPPNPTELLGSVNMGKMLKHLGDIYDYVIIDTPPVSVVTDAAVLSQYVDGVLFVVRQNDVTFEQARLAKKNLDAVNANILGVVINDFNMKRIDRSSGHYYSYYYQYGNK